MQAFIFYLFYPFVIIIAHLPFRFLYKISNLLYFIYYHIVSYRKQVVKENLRNSFPEKSEEEIIKLCKNHFRYLSDLIVEVTKTIAWKEKDVLERVKMTNYELIERFAEKNKNIILVLGHFGNWEWAGPCFSLQNKDKSNKHRLNVIYLPLSNPYFEKVLVKARTKFNTKITPKKNALREIIADKTKLTATALLSDQSPSPITSAHWMRFLNQETAVFKGPAKIAKKMDYPVVYVEIDKLKRGFYEITAHIICENPNTMSEIEITEAFNRRLEEDILKQKELWLWSHRRWKNKRMDNKV